MKCNEFYTDNLIIYNFILNPLSRLSKKDQHELIIGS